MSAMTGLSLEAHQHGADTSAQESKIEALHMELACQAKQLTRHAKVMTEFNQKHAQEVSELHDTISSLQQDKLAFKQDRSLQLNVGTGTIIKVHRVDCKAFFRNHCLEVSTSTMESQLETNLKHKVNGLCNQEARANAENNVQNAHVEMDEDEYYSWFINDAKSLADMIHAECDRFDTENRKEFQDQIDAVKAHYAMESEDKIHAIQTKYEVERKTKEEARKRATANEQKRIVVEEKVKNLELKIRQLECDVASRALKVSAGPSLLTAEWLADVPPTGPMGMPGISSEMKFGDYEGPPSAAKCQHSFSHSSSCVTNSVNTNETNAALFSMGAILNNTIPLAFWWLECLHLNMAVLHTQHPKWFLTSLTGHPSPVIFKNIKGLQPVFSAHIRKLHALSSYEKSNTVNNFLVFLNQLLHEQLQPLIELVISISVSSISSPMLEECFDDMFTVGPGSLSILISFLMELFNVFCALPKDISLNDSGASAQSLWDADSCRDLIYILHNHSNKLPIGTAQSNLYTCFSKINITEDPLKLNYIMFLLANTFRNLSDPKNMCHDAICTGQYGLDAFYLSVVVPVLNDIDCDVDGYNDLLTVLVKLCEGLAHKASNIVKSCKRPSREDANKDSRMNGAVNSHRETRSLTGKKSPDPSACGATLNLK
ncbi:hypothetical protein F5146DRAFT_1147104 [Armillaria mellea]|nr:hypothetical protein F5146DRAFT_1147104 [Armillaria mellea]